MLESTRAEEERVKRETAEGLEQFRRQQEEADKKARGSDEPRAADEGSPIVDEEQWVTGGRKRKRAKEKDGLKGVKIRRSSTTEKAADPSVTQASSSSCPSTTKKLAKGTESKAPEQSKSKPAPLASAEKAPPAPAKNSGLGLVDYGSDDDD